MKAKRFRIFPLFCGSCKTSGAWRRAQSSWCVQIANLFPKGDPLMPRYSYKVFSHLAAEWVYRSALKGLRLFSLGADLSKFWAEFSARYDSIPKKLWRCDLDFLLKFRGQRRAAYWLRHRRKWENRCDEIPTKWRQHLEALTTNL